MCAGVSLLPISRQRLAFITLPLVIPLLIGAVGYIVIDGFPILDAFYMAVMTVTTVGYGEVRRLSQAGRIFNMFVMLTGVSGLLIALSGITQTIIELELSNFFQKRRMKQMIDKLEGHFIICGYGRVGRNSAAELKRENASVLVLDSSEDRVEMAIRSGLLAALGDATLDATLRDVHIEKAAGVIASLPSDADNLFLVISAKLLNPRLRIAARVNEEEAESKLRRAGADAVLAPFAMTGSRLVQSILRPHVVQFLEFTTMNFGFEVGMEQIEVTPESSFQSRSLRDMQIRRDLGVIVLAVRKSNGQMLFNPAAETIIEGGDHLIAMGGKEQLATLEHMLGSRPR